MYPIVTSSGCPEKSFLSNTTLGVSIHETPRPRFRRRPRPHRRSCHNTGFIRYHENPDHRRSNQHAAGPDLRPRRSERLRNCSRPLKSNTSIAYGNAFSKKESFHEIDHSRIRRRPRCHRCSCHNSDFIRLNAESCRCRPDQHVASPHLCPRRSERLRNCSRPLNNDNSIAYLIILPKRGSSMKSIVRAFVFALVLTGVAATTQTSSASTKNHAVAARTSMLPVPTCAPDDPNACGIAQGR